MDISKETVEEVIKIIENNITSSIEEELKLIEEEATYEMKWRINNENKY